MCLSLCTFVGQVEKNVILKFLSFIFQKKQEKIINKRYRDGPSGNTVIKKANNKYDINRIFMSWNL